MPLNCVNLAWQLTVSPGKFMLPCLMGGCKLFMSTTCSHLADHPQSGAVPNRHIDMSRSSRCWKWGGDISHPGPLPKHSLLHHHRCARVCLQHRGFDFQSLGGPFSPDMAPLLTTANNRQKPHVFLFEFILGRVLRRRFRVTLGSFGFCGGVEGWEPSKAPGAYLPFTGDGYPGTALVPLSIIPTTSFPDRSRLFSSSEPQIALRDLEQSGLRVSPQL